MERLGNLGRKFLPVACCSQSLLSREGHQDGDVYKDGTEEDYTKSHRQHNR